MVSACNRRRSIGDTAMDENSGSMARGARILRAALVGGGIALFCAASAGPALAQSGQVKPFALSTPAKPDPKENDDGSVTISVSYQFVLTGDPDSISEQARLSENGRRAVYSLLANECAALLETIASSCAISRANVSSRMNTGSSRFRSGGVTVSGSANYRITLKSASGPINGNSGSGRAE